MKIAIYLAAIPKNKNEAKLAILKKFGQGVSVAGDSVEYVTDDKIVISDVAVMQGFVHKDISSPHLQLRHNILKNNNNTLVIDSNIFQFSNPALQNYYLRYSLNGVFPTTGFYFDNKLDSNRWQSISNKLGINLKDYRNTGNHILICLQRVNGWSMCGTDVQQWLDQTVATVRRYSNRPIIVRKHPGDRRQDKLQFSTQYTISNSDSIIKDFKNCWATITYNSSPGIASLIHGVPVFVTDRTPQQSQTWPICNTNLSQIENPLMPDRQEWIDRISQCHWNDDEISSGEAWKFMRERLEILKPNLFCIDR
jgi:hypothetical protein